MPKSLAFWIVYLLAILLWGFFNWPLGMVAVPSLIIFFLIGIIGWAVFGPPIQ